MVRGGRGDRGGLRTVQYVVIHGELEDSVGLTCRDDDLLLNGVRLPVVAGREQGRYVRLGRDIQADAARHRPVGLRHTGRELDDQPRLRRCVPEVDVCDQLTGMNIKKVRSGQRVAHCAGIRLDPLAPHFLRDDALARLRAKRVVSRRIGQRERFIDVPRCIRVQIHVDLPPLEPLFPGVPDAVRVRVTPLGPPELALVVLHGNRVPSLGKAHRNGGDFRCSHAIHVSVVLNAHVERHRRRP